ncbi:hypothetical protein K2173_001883 [Erythroxylum novogranatense]|uniref:PGG domain-containing protein n=1 Tax=Erythroxylum novogranatense TaxID=1862640 RepID=A0AAV8SP14_9ROSI|nr:hypothetical protein K2173_001883 [Erythroxylum novogranatense]
MDTRLFEVSFAGNVVALRNLLEQDPAILDRVPLFPPAFVENPLHISCLRGHVDFAREILSLRPTFVQEINQDGHTPLHLASSKGYIDIVKLILNFGNQNSCVADLCMNKDPYLRTPLHCAVITGRVDIINELLKACPKSASEVTVQNETVLHLAVKYNQQHVFRFLVGGICNTETLLNYRDSDGNTILHLATIRKQIQTIEFLHRQANLNVNVLNSRGLTAIDLLMIGPPSSCDTEIGEKIRSAGGGPSISNHQPVIDSVGKGFNTDEDQKDKYLTEITNGLLVMASLVATVTFQIAVTPPGGFWQDFPEDSNGKGVTSNNKTHAPGTAILYDLEKNNYIHFIYVDTLAFMASLTLIVALLSPNDFERFKCCGLDINSTKMKSIKWRGIRHLTYLVVVMIIYLFTRAVSITAKHEIYRTPLFYAVIVPCSSFLGSLVYLSLTGAKMKHDQRDNAEKV